MQGTLLVALAAVVSGSGPTWDDVSTAIDGYSLVPNCLVIIGDASGVKYTHTKGSFSSGTHISVASASKWVSGAVIMRMVEDGIVSLFDSPSAYLSWWTTDASDPRSKVTLRELMSFTGGFTDNDGCLGDNSYTLESCAEQIYNTAADPSKFNAPGTTFYYGGNNLQVAGAMVASASQKSWSDLVDKYINTPLDITSLLTVYTPKNNPNIAGGWYASTDDYMQFLTAFFGGSLLQSSSYDLMFTDNTPSASVTIAYSPVSVAKPPQEWHYCLANWLECESKPFAASCVDRRVHSSPGKFGFYPRIDLLNGYYSVVARQSLALFAYSQSVEMFQLIESNVTQLMGRGGVTQSTPIAPPTEGGYVTHGTMLMCLLPVLLALI
eukprot:TRINITY_DN11226_c0_g1_i1.p1 TRINITY_DN11226_c0_g1~~TRINITY_DN11226_c0_g1_i1.p1  ORF type:complete len:396 (+),score=86.53 TRINITY_DN11226_c0_g1_i1:50-1189(+)